MSVKKIIIVGTIFVFLMAIVYGATNIQTNQSIQRGMTYLSKSEGTVWNATDYAALLYLKKEFNVSISNQTIQNVALKKSFDPNQYPFLTSIFTGNIQPPAGIENNLGTPTIIYRILTCDDFSNNEMNIMASQINTVDKKYVATHAVLMLNLIKKTYAQNCGKQAIATSAGIAQTQALNGLQLPEPTPQNMWDFDAYLEQECARSITTGITNPTQVTQLISLQDKNQLEPRTFGGWYQYGYRLNEPYVIYDDTNFEASIYYPELPNAHTTLFAMCILGKAVNAT